MLLCIDCGNTRLKWGLHEGGKWREQGFLPLPEIERLPKVLDEVPRPDRVIACNVASQAATMAIEAAAAALDLKLAWAVSRAEQCGVKNSYDDPAQLGADRWAALLGARRIHGGACLVVNSGTATTVDVLDAAGIFQGGLILPGIRLMQTALARDTARLSFAAGGFSPLPRNTADAIASGALLATAGAISRMFAQVAAGQGAMCLLSGGAAGPLMSVLDMPLRRVDNLVLEGLLSIAAEES